MPKITFSDRYRLPIRCAVIWLLILALWCSLVLDAGESINTFLYSLVAYVVLLLLIMLRRPAIPTRFDLLLIGWGLPILFFSGLFLYPLVWHMRGVY